MLVSFPCRLDDSGPGMECRLRHAPGEAAERAPAPPAPPLVEVPPDTPWPSKFVPPGDWSPRSASLMPLDVTVEIPEVPPEIMGPSPPIEDDPGENR